MSLFLMKNKRYRNTPKISIIINNEEIWAGLHDIVPDRSSAKVAPVGCQRAKTVLTIKTVTVPKGWLPGRRCHPVWGISASGVSCTNETGGLSAALGVSRLGRCRATGPWLVLSLKALSAIGTLISSFSWFCPQKR